MWLLAAVMLAVVAPVPAVVEHDGVRIAVSIRAHVYTWTVTNLDAAPITSFQIELHNCYNHQVPMGWIQRVDGSRFAASAAAGSSGIQRGSSGSFSAQVSSGGAALGAVSATVGTGAGGGNAIVFDAVWGPVAKPRSLVILVALGLGGITVLHALAVARKARRRARSAARDPAPLPSSGSGH